MTYSQSQFDQELKKMLQEARAKGKPRLRVVSKTLHDRVVHTDDHRMPMACNAMWKLYEKQGGTVINPKPQEMSSKQTTKIEIEFDTA